MLRYALASYLIVSTITVVGNLSARTALPALGGVAFLIYYWLGAPGLGKAYGAPEVGPIVVRAAAVTLLATWAWHGWRRALRRRVSLTMYQLSGNRREVRREVPEHRG